MKRPQGYEGTGSVKGRVRRKAAPAQSGTIGIGLIGCGGMGRYVARKVLSQDPRLQVRGLFDPDERSVKASREQVAPDATVYRDYRELCAAKDIDWVMIASWNCYHKDHTVAAFQAGKHVFCQKPLATTVDDCLAMRDAWLASGRMFNIGFTLRYSPHYRTIRRLLDEGAVGQLLSFEFNEVIGFNHGGYIMGDWRRLTKYAGTHLLEKCCHDIDLANWFVGSRAARVASFAGLDFFVPGNEKHMQRLGKDDRGRQAYQTWGGLVDLNPFTSDKDVFDNQVGIIEYGNRVRATFHANCNSAIPERRMYLNGTEGAIRADVISGRIELARIGFKESVQEVKAGVSGGHGGGDDVLAKELADSILHGTKPSVGLDEGLASAFTCFGMDQSVTTGRVVDMAPYWARAAGTQKRRAAA